MYILVSIALVLVASSVTNAGCPDFTFRCPTGENFTFGTCYVWSKFGCFTCRDMITEVKHKCRKYSCKGSVDHWYDRNDGCSAGIAAGAMNQVFRGACAIHDICYATPGRNQNQCDSDFLHNMRETCQIPGIASIGTGLCYAAAQTAYAAVQTIYGNTFQDFAATCTEV